MPERKSVVPAVKLALYDKLIATAPGVRRKGAASAYTSLNGHMFSFMTGEGRLALRVSPEHREALGRRFRLKEVIQYGAVMRGYVEIPDALLRNTAELEEHFAMSIRYIESLEPRPTTRKATKTVARKKSAKKK